MSATIRYDLVVIGSGPAGEKAATTAASLGRRVALIEKDPYIGGASTNTGTLPSKTFRETAVALSGWKTRSLYGVDVNLALHRKATLQDFMYHEESVKVQERTRVREVLEGWKVDYVEGLASFVDPHTLSVAGKLGDQLVAADFILLATGSSPVRPAIFDFDDYRIHDSDEILGLESMPGSIAIVGAGVIGSEYACTFAALGVETHLIDGRDILLSYLDREVSAALTEEFEELGIRFHRPVKVIGCAAQSDGKMKLECDPGPPIEVDQVLVAAGRCSNVEKLNLSAAGITPGARGLITVDETYRTSVPHIFAAGDIIGFPSLAATSFEQGRIAVHHAFSETSKLKLTSILPTGIYTIPEVSMIGETEESLKLKNIPYVSGHARYDQTVRGQIIGESAGFLKLIFSDDESMKLLGAHCMGEIATEVIHIGLLAMVTGAGRDLFEASCFNYPTLGDLYKIATFDACCKQQATKNPKS